MYLKKKFQPSILIIAPRRKVEATDQFAMKRNIPENQAWKSAFEFLGNPEKKTFYIICPSVFSRKITFFTNKQFRGKNKTQFLIKNYNEYFLCEATKIILKF